MISEPAVRSWPLWSTGIDVAVTDPAALDRAAQLVGEHLAEVEAAVSRFRPDSEISRLPNAVTPLFSRYLGAALEAARETDGILDPTIGGVLVDLGYDADIEVVQKAAIERERRPIPGWRSVLLADDRLVVVPGTRLDLGSTAKALAADECANLVATALGCGVLINLGGDVATAGGAPRGGWIVGVDSGVGDDTVISLTEGSAVATSSTLLRRWRTGVAERHHLIDPRTLEPAVTPWAAVTVAAADCLTANVASSAAVILGDAGPDWVAARRLPARFVSVDGVVVTTPGWPAPEVAA